MTTPLRRVGALALATTTIVTGLSLGPAATASPPADPLATSTPPSEPAAAFQQAPFITYAKFVTGGAVRIMGRAPAGAQLKTTNDPAAGWFTLETGLYVVPASGNFDITTHRRIGDLAAVRAFLPNGGPSPESNRVLAGQDSSVTYNESTDTVNVHIKQGVKNADIYAESLDGSVSGGIVGRTDADGNARFTLPQGVGADHLFRMSYGQAGTQQTLWTGRSAVIPELRVERGADGRVTVSGSIYATSKTYAVHLSPSILHGDSVQGTETRPDNTFSFVLNDSASRLTEGYIYTGTGGVRTKFTINPFSATVDSVDVEARTARISGTAAPGAYVVINDDDEVQASTQGTWSYDLDNLDLRKNTVTLEHYENNVKTRSTTLEVDLALRDVTATATLTTDTTEQAVLTGTAHPGATIIARDNTTTEIARTNADTTGAWTTPIPAPDTGGDYPLHITQEITGDEDPAGPTPVTIAYGAAVAITMPVEDMAHDGGPVTMRGTGEPGAQITVREQGRVTVLGTTRVLQSGSWNLQTTNVDARKVTLETTQRGKGRNTTLATVTLNPEEAPAAPLVVTNPDAEQLAAGYTPNLSYTFEGTGNPSSEIVVRNSKGLELGPAATVTDTGDWTWTRTNMGTYNWTIDFIQDEGTPTEQRQRIANFKPAEITPGDPGTPVQVTNPTPAQIAAGYTPNAAYTFEGTGTTGSTITVQNSKGLELGPATTVTNGTWSWTRTNMGTYDWTIDFVQDKGLPTEQKARISGFKPGQGVILPLEVLNPSPAQVAAGYTPDAPFVFRGTGASGSTVTIQNAKGLELGHPVVADGTWSWTRTNMGTYEWTLDFIQDKGTDNATTVRITDFKPAPN